MLALFAELNTDVMALADDVTVEMAAGPIYAIVSEPVFLSWSTAAAGHPSSTAGG
jgi:hypothetical protein